MPRTDAEKQSMALVLNPDFRNSSWKGLAHTWCKRVEECRQFIRISNFAQDRTAFRELLQELCDVESLSDVNGLCIGLHLENIDIFVRVIDRQNRLNAPKTLSQITYTAMFMSLYESANTPVGITNMSKLLGQLNTQMPNLSEHVLGSSDDYSSQNTLRRAFVRYMEHLIEVLESFDTLTPSSSRGSDPSTISKLQQVESRVRALGPELNTLLMPVLQQVQNLPTSPSNASQQSVDGFITRRFLGRGSFGTVNEVEDENTGNRYAKKTTRIQPIRRSYEENKKRVETEFATMERIQHTHIVRVWKLRFEEYEHFSFLMYPVADMNLGQYLSDCVQGGFAPMELNNIIGWYGCLLKALAYLHRERVQHNDLKPQNILIKDENGGLKVYLTDFGLARDLRNEAHSSIGDDDDYIRGTPNYRAPELKPGMPPDYACDVYALGCVFAEMTTVLCKKSLDDFRDYRSISSFDHPFAFRHNPRQIVAWLNDLEAEEAGGNSGTDLVYHVKKMMNHNPAMRPRPKDSIKVLKLANDGSRFFCDGCIDHG